MWDTFITATSLVQVLELLAKHGKNARIVNGGTDLLIEIERKARTPSVVIDGSRRARRKAADLGPRAGARGIHRIDAPPVPGRGTQSLNALLRGRNARHVKKDL